MISISMGKGTKKMSVSVFLRKPTDVSVLFLFFSFPSLSGVGFAQRTDSHVWSLRSHARVTLKSLACVASISVGLSASLKHFSLFERAKIGAKKKKMPRTGGKTYGNACYTG